MLAADKRFVVVVGSVDKVLGFADTVLGVADTAFGAADTVLGVAESDTAAGVVAALGVAASFPL